MEYGSAHAHYGFCIIYLEQEQSLEGDVAGVLLAGFRPDIIDEL